MNLTLKQTTKTDIFLTIYKPRTQLTLSVRPLIKERWNQKSKEWIVFKTDNMPI